MLITPSVGGMGYNLNDSYLLGMGIPTTPLQYLVFAYGVHASRIHPQQIPLLPAENYNSKSQKMVGLAAIFESFKIDITQACIQYKKLYTTVTWPPQQLVQYMAKSWQDLDIRGSSPFGEEDLTLNDFLTGFATSWLDAYWESLGNIITWKDISQLSHHISLSIEFPRCERNRSRNSCSSSGDAEGTQLMKLLELMVGIVRDIIGEGVSSSLEVTLWVSSFFQSEHTGNHATSGRSPSWGGTGYRESCSKTSETQLLVYGRLPDKQQKYVTFNCTESLLGIGGGIMSGWDTYMSVSFVEESTMDSVPIQVSGKRAPADEKLTYALRSVISILSDCHASSATPTGLCISVVDSQKSLVSRNMTLDLASPEPLKMSAIEVEGLTNLGAPEEEELDKYWTWNIEAQKFVHVDEDTGETIYHPDEFD